MERIRTTYFWIVKIIAVLAVVGAGLLIYTGLDDPTATAFYLIAFAVSVIALVLTALQSIAIARQAQITQKAARLVDEAADRIQALVAADHSLQRDIRQDIALDQEVIAVLEEFGVGENEEERTKVAQRVSRRVAKKHKH